MTPSTGGTGYVECFHFYTVKQIFLKIPSKGEVLYCRLKAFDLKFKMLEYRAKLKGLASLF